MYVLCRPHENVHQEYDSVDRTLMLAVLQYIQQPCLISPVIIIALSPKPARFVVVSAQVLQRMAAYARSGSASHRVSFKGASARHFTIPHLQTAGLKVAMAVFNRDPDMTADTVKSQERTRTCSVVARAKNCDAYGVFREVCGVLYADDAGIVPQSSSKLGGYLPR